MAAAGAIGERVEGNGSQPAGKNIPRLDPNGDALSAEDAARYRQAFASTVIADWAGADAALAQIQDRRLVGHVLAIRLLHPTMYKPGYEELSAWLRDYGDHPDAAAIYRLALHRKSADAPAPPHPRDGVGFVGAEMPAFHLPGPAYVGRLKLSGSYGRADRTTIDRTVNAVLAHLRDGAPATALRVLQDSAAEDLLDREDLAALRLRIAAELLYAGQDKGALMLAGQSLEGAQTSEAHWIAGLAAFRHGKFESATDHFSTMADLGAEQGNDPWVESAGAFWAARAAERDGDDEAAQGWLKRAAGDKLTFYGLIAQRVLSQPAVEGAMTAPALTPARRHVLETEASGWRALALLQVGQADRAEAELRQIEASGNPQLKEALLAVAADAHLAELSQRLGVGLQGVDGRIYDSGPYPVPRWKPRAGFSVDPALLYAIMRQESRFDPGVTSGAGAIGLMQIMPSTAAQVSGRHGDWDTLLLQPETNLDLGQHYVHALLADDGIGDNLIMMAAAYNGGPSALTRWRRDNDEEDPLLFLETLPVGETRGFVEQVLTNYWIYGQRMNRPTPSLDDLAAGKWPLYHDPLRAATMVAALQ